eukprot:TRINITY_DN7696_c0_g1_i8.p1 TRINITY_DN7696_c0_g1~~TRINITY_DN7696_c0_g1_i8.p1  ORF type:complete len:421 (-),score=41.50 TRINITY_DN7696_c0_g1_i8:566-1744(-)
MAENKTDEELVFSFIKRLGSELKKRQKTWSSKQATVALKSATKNLPQPLKEYISDHFNQCLKEISKILEVELESIRPSKRQKIETLQQNVQKISNKQADIIIPLEATIQNQKVGPVGNDVQMKDQQPLEKVRNQSNEQNGNQVNDLVMGEGNQVDNQQSKITIDIDTIDSEILYKKWLELKTICTLEGLLSNSPSVFFPAVEFLFTYFQFLYQFGYIESQLEWVSQMLKMCQFGDSSIYSRIRLSGDEQLKTEYVIKQYTCLFALFLVKKEVSNENIITEATVKSQVNIIRKQIDVHLGVVTEIILGQEKLANQLVQNQFLNHKQSMLVDVILFSVAVNCDWSGEFSEDEVDLYFEILKGAIKVKQNRLKNRIRHFIFFSICSKLIKSTQKC